MIRYLSHKSVNHSSLAKIQGILFLTLIYFIKHGRINEEWFLIHNSIDLKFVKASVVSWEIIEVREIVGEVVV